MKFPNGKIHSQGNLDFNQSQVIENVPLPIISLSDKDKDNNKPEFSIFNYPSVLPFNFHSSKDVDENMKEYQKADREMFILLLLDSKNNVLKIEPHTIGTVDGCAVYPREIFKSAILNSASSIICVHHHPSGDPLPSEADRQITKQIVNGGHLLGVKVLDHVVLGKDSYFSFADEGLIDDYEKLAVDSHLRTV